MDGSVMFVGFSSEAPKGSLFEITDEGENLEPAFEHKRSM